MSETPADEKLVETLSAKVAELEKQLVDMTNDRNAFRSQKQAGDKIAEELKAELAKAKAAPASSAAADSVLVKGKARKIVKVLDAFEAHEQIMKNNDGAQESTWVQVK